MKTPPANPMTSRPLRILIVGSVPSSIKNFRGALIETMVAGPHEVHVAAPELSDDISTCRWLTAVGAYSHNVPLSRTGISPLVDARSAMALFKLMRKIKPDIYLGYTAKPVIWGILAGWLAGVPKRVAMITGLGYAFTGTAAGKRLLIRHLLIFLYGLAMRRAHLVFFQNPDDQSDFARMKLLPRDLPRKIVNGSGVDTSTFTPTELPPPPLHFLMISRLIGDKGVREYANAARRVKKANPEVQFHLVGPIDANPDGIPEEEIRSWSSGNFLTWHGETDDVRPYIAACHVFVLPSYREGTPRTVLEAMAMGRPIITTFAPGCRETVINGENGFLVLPRDVTDLVNRMKNLISDPSLCKTMGAKSLKIVKEQYDVREVNNTIMSALNMD